MVQDARHLSTHAARARDPAIGDYAAIGDCRTAAMVSRSGSIDWLCLPRFDSPSVFAAILEPDTVRCGRGPTAAGRFCITPQDRFTSVRRYLPETNIVETTFRTRGGEVRLVDCMPVTDEEHKKRALWPDHEVLRLIEGVEGVVALEVSCEPRMNYGLRTPGVRRWGPGNGKLPQDRGGRVFRFVSGDTALTLTGEAPLEQIGEGRVGGRVVVRAGERRFISLAYGREEPMVVPPLGGAAEERLRETRRWWEVWSAHCHYHGPEREIVLRSALALKLMTFAPSGAIVAAPTTSLPEEIGGERNWDYRYCWLRDAALTLRALFDLGYDKEADAFLDWALHATWLTLPRLQVLYDVHGRARLPERVLTHLGGHRGSRPVRVGNAAWRQEQHDVYGAVVLAATQLAARGGDMDRAARRMLVGLGETVCRIWREPDEGIWEVRSGRAHHTYSKVMCWAALEGLIGLHTIGLCDAPVEQFERERNAIRAEVESRGYNEALGSYSATLDGDTLDASLLEMIPCGYLDPRSERARSTVRAVYRELGMGRAGGAGVERAGPLLRRYPPGGDGVAGGEGAFGICCFWGVEALARIGEVAAARSAFHELCGYANDVGLFAEEIDPGTGAALGNFPQAFTHVGLIGAALALQQAERGEAHIQTVVSGASGGWRAEVERASGRGLPG